MESMPKDEPGQRPKSGRGELAFIIVSAAIFLAIAGCVVYFVARLII